MIFTTAVQQERIKKFLYRLTNGSKVAIHVPMKLLSLIHVR